MFLALMIARRIRPYSAVKARYIDAMIVCVLTIAAFLTVASAITATAPLWTAITASRPSAFTAAAIIAIIALITAATLSAFYTLTAP